MKSRTRLKDIADHLHVSTALVSGVLNRRPNVWASEETRTRILKAAEELNYQPSRAAQNLVRGKSNSVALVYRRLPEAKFRLAYTGLLDVLFENLQEHCYDLSVANFATNGDVLAHLDKLAADRSCDAVLLWGREADTEEQAEHLQKLGIPFVVKGRHEEKHPDWNQVDYDHEGMMRTAVERLVSLGHERIAYLGFPHDEGYVRGLRRGFEAAHRELLGAEARTEWMGACEDLVAPNEAIVEGWLSADEQPTGFVIGAGNAAWQALELGLARRGQRLSHERGGSGAAGIVSIDFTLLFGEAMAFQGIEVDHLARMAGTELLNSVLKGVAHKPIHRYCPPLTEAPSLHLADRLPHTGGADSIFVQPSNEGDSYENQ